MTCSEQEAAELAGVSSKTLKRFHESGYLHVSVDSDGKLFYSRDQILEIFGISQSVAHLNTTDEKSCSDDVEETQKIADEAIGQDTCSPDEIPTAGACPPSADNTVSDCAFQDTSASEVPGQLGARSETTKDAEEIPSANELERLKNLISIQEKMLDGKEDEIADLKNQRAWLRERIERLEEKGERDQILLLSETQTIRSLISYQENKRSPVRQLLEWMGFSKPEETDAPKATNTNSARTSSHRTIEVDRVGNG